MRHVLFLFFFLFSLQSFGLNSNIHVEPALVQQKIQPAFNKILTKKMKNYATIKYKQFSNTSADKSEQKMEENRGFMCGTIKEEIYDNFKRRILLICNVEATRSMCNDSDARVDRLTKDAVNSITANASGVLSKLVSTRDTINNILTATIDANNTCSEHLQSTVLSDSCLSSFEIALNEKALSSVEDHCNIEQIQELKINIEDSLYVLGESLTDIQERHIGNRKNEVDIYNLMVKIEDSISQIESNQRAPSNNAKQMPVDGN